MDLRQRVELLVKAEKNPDLQAIHLELCRRDPVHFFNYFCYTMDPRTDSPNAIPFNLYPYQEWFVNEIVYCMEEQLDMGVEKSRDMGASWVFMLTFQWAWLFKSGWDIHVGSRREAEVDTASMDPSTLFGKFRYNLYKLPRWMRPPNMKLHDKKLLIVNPTNGNILSGESANDAFGIGPRKRAIMLDEFSRWESADVVYDGLAQTTRCRIINGTPFGEANAYAHKMHNKNNIYIPYPGEYECLKEKGLVA